MKYGLPVGPDDIEILQRNTGFRAKTDDGFPVDAAKLEVKA